MKPTQAQCNCIPAWINDAEIHGIECPINQDHNLKFYAEREHIRETASAQPENYGSGYPYNEHDKLQVQLAQVTAQRDELLAALKDAQNLLARIVANPNSGLSTSECDHINERTIGYRAAIQKQTNPKH